MRVDGSPGAPPLGAVPIGIQVDHGACVASLHEALSRQVQAFTVTAGLYTALFSILFFIITSGSGSAYQKLGAAWAVTFAVLVVNFGAWGIIRYESYIQQVAIARLAQIEAPTELRFLHQVLGIAVEFEFRKRRASRYGNAPSGARARHST